MKQITLEQNSDVLLRALQLLALFWALNSASSAYADDWACYRQRSEGAFGPVITNRCYQNCERVRSTYPGKGDVVETECIPAPSVYCYKSKLGLDETCFQTPDECEKNRAWASDPTKILGKHTDDTSCRILGSAPNIMPTPITITPDNILPETTTPTEPPPATPPNDDMLSPAPPLPYIDTPLRPPSTFMYGEFMFFSTDRALLQDAVGGAAGLSYTRPLSEPGQVSPFLRLRGLLGGLQGSGLVFDGAALAGLKVGKSAITLDLAGGVGLDMLGTEDPVPDVFHMPPAFSWLITTGLQLGDPSKFLSTRFEYSFLHRFDETVETEGRLSFLTHITGSLSAGLSSTQYNVNDGKVASTLTPFFYLSL